MMTERTGQWILSTIFAAGFMVSLITGKTLGTGAGTLTIIKRSENPGWYWFSMFWLALASVLCAFGDANFLQRHSFLN